MKRRDMMALGGTFAAMTLVPTVVAATPTLGFDLSIFDTIEEVDQHYAALKSFGMTHAEEALTLGFKTRGPYLSTTPEGLQTLLYKFALDHDFVEFWDRLHWIDRINRGLHERFGSDWPLARNAYIHSTHHVGHQTLRDMMTSGRRGLEFAAHVAKPFD